MQTITRHGGGSHYVRPDRVYRTGVLTSTMGYDPGQDVQNVAASFTAYPMDLQVPSASMQSRSGAMSGLRGLGRALGANNVGLLQRMKLRYDAWRARRQMQGLYGLGNTGARQTGVAYPQVGMSIQPPIFDRSDMANILMQSSPDPGIAAAQAGYSWDYWINQRWK
jgi:hypothetical protein